MATVHSRTFDRFPATRSFWHAASARLDLQISAVILLTACIRLAVCLLTDNQSGDADARAALSGEWAHAPHWIAVGAWLPLHFYVTGILTRFLGNPIFAGKALSLVTGTLTVIPLFRLTQRLFDKRAAVVAGLLFAVYGMQVALSSVVMSEAPYGLFAMVAISVYFAESTATTPRLSGLLWAAVCLAIAGGFRQEAWLLSAILTGFLLWRPDTRRYAIPFALVAFSSFAVISVSEILESRGWLRPMLAVSQWKGSEALHHHFSAAENILRWVWICVQSPGPLITALMAYGVYVASNQPARRDLALVAAFLIGPFVLLSIVTPQWQPQSRYPFVSFMLMLPFAAAAMGSIRARYHLRALTTIVILFSVLLQGVAFHRRSRLFLPVQDYSAADSETWRGLAANAEPDSVLIVEDTGWRSPGLIVHSGLYTHTNFTIYSWTDPEVLKQLIARQSFPVLLVLNSPLSKWPFLERLNPQLLFGNSDYRVFRVQR